MRRFQIDSDIPDTEVIDEVGDAIAGTGAEDWLWALLILIVAVVLSRVARSTLTRVVASTGSNSFLSDFLGRLLGYTIVAFGVVYALEAVGVRITPLLGALGLLGVALAFALQSILENFVAGALLQVRRPFSKGDEIESQDYVGTITSIDSRTLTIRTPSGEIVRLPNAEVIRSPIINLSQNGRRRTSVPLGVAYGTDLRRAVEVATDALGGVEGVLDEPSPVVLVSSFGDSSIDLTAMFWHEPSIAEKLRAQHAVAISLAEAFEQAEISIPFPQRTLHFSSEAATLLSERVETPHDPAR